MWQGVSKPFGCLAIIYVLFNCMKVAGVSNKRWCCLKMGRLCEILRADFHDFFLVLSTL